MAEVEYRYIIKLGLGGVLVVCEECYQFTQGYNILHRLQVHHLTLTVIIHNKYI